MSDLHGISHIMDWCATLDSFICVLSFDFHRVDPTQLRNFSTCYLITSYVSPLLLLSACDFVPACMAV